MVFSFSSTSLAKASVMRASGSYCSILGLMISPSRSRYLKSPKSGDRKAFELTPRQRDVLRLVVEGRAAKEIAKVLSISPRTVEFHKYRIMETLGCRTTAEMIQYAITQHLVVL